MNNRLLRRVAVLLVTPFVPAIACGGRTGDLDLYGADSGAARGSGGASNGKLGPGGAVVNPPATGKPPKGNPPVLGSGGTIGRPPPPPLSGGKAAFGGSAGAVAAGGAVQPGCGPPFCNCGDCVSSCACMLGGQTQYCIDQCSGNTGAGGAPPVVCAGPPGQGARICPSSGSFPFPGCCTAARECGFELLAPSGMSTTPYPFATGCQAVDQPGRPEPSCPDLSTLLNAGVPTAGSGGPPSCCRTDGTCGIDASQVGLGCVQSLLGGRPIECPQDDAGAGGHPPVDAAIVD